MEEFKSPFKEEKFLSIHEKEKVLKNWIRFVSNGFARNDFTKALYAHLMNHADFIAHCNIHGFFDEYFTTGADKIRFLEQFDRQKMHGRDSWAAYKLTGDYSDINNAMVDELAKYLPVLYAAATAEQKQLDLTVAEQLLARHGLTLTNAVKPVSAQTATAAAGTQVSLF